MNRIVNILLVVLMIIGAAAVYDMKYEAEIAAERVADLRAQVVREREEISLLKAEWSLLNQPARLQKLVDRYHQFLELEPVDVRQILAIEELPARPLDLRPFAPGPRLGGLASDAGRAVQ